MVRSARYPSAFVVVLLGVGAAACATSRSGADGQLDAGQGGSPSSSGASSESPSEPNGGPTGDPGASSSGSSGSSGGPTGDDADSGGDAEQAVPEDAGGAATDAPIDLGSLFPPPAPSSPSDAMSCANLGCFDVFDCAIYHAAEFGPCGFTQCVNLVCK